MQTLTFLLLVLITCLTLYVTMKVQAIDQHLERFHDHVLRDHKGASPRLDPSVTQSIMQEALGALEESDDEDAPPSST